LKKNIFFFKNRVKNNPKDGDFKILIKKLPEKQKACLNSDRLFALCM